VSYTDGYKGVERDNNMGQNPVATSAAVIVIAAIIFLGGISLAFKGSVHF